MTRPRIRLIPPGKAAISRHDRDSERLRAWLPAVDAALAGVGEGFRPLVVEGDPGIGKTTVLRAATGHAEDAGFRILSGPGAPGTDGGPGTAGANQTRRATVDPMRKRDLRLLEEILESHGGFGHREHLKLAWTYLRLYPINEAAEVMVSAIRHVARRHGAEDNYHETITRSWLHFVAVHMQRWGAESFEGFIERNPDLLERNLIEHFYSRELVFSGSARASWVSPDLRALPALG